MEIIEVAEICDWYIESLNWLIAWAHERYFRIHRKTVLPANKFAIQARGSKHQNMAKKQKNMPQTLFPNECKAINCVKKRLQHRWSPEHLFWSTSANDCFWLLSALHTITLMHCKAGQFYPIYIILTTDMAKKWHLWQELLKSASKIWKPNYNCMICCRQQAEGIN